MVFNLSIRDALLGASSTEWCAVYPSQYPRMSCVSTPTHSTRLKNVTMRDNSPTPSECYDIHTLITYVIYMRMWRNACYAPYDYCIVLLVRFEPLRNYGLREI